MKTKSVLSSTTNYFWPFNKQIDQKMTYNGFENAVDRAISED